MTAPAGSISTQLYGQPEPLRLTLAQWHNKKAAGKRGLDGMPAERWTKVLAHKRPLTQFAYGTRTASDWERPGLQLCIILAPHTGVMGIDVDSWTRLAGTQLGRLLAPPPPISIRQGGERRHYLIDARGVPPELWPVMGPLYGDSDIGHLKSNGWIPVPGSEHWSGELYEPVRWPDGTSHIIAATPELIAAIAEARSVPSVHGNDSNGGGTGGGHDGDIAAQTMGLVRRAVNAGGNPADPAVKEQVYASWLQIAIPLDPDWPYELGDFERHYRTAVQKVAATPNQPLDSTAAAWADRITVQQPEPVPVRTCAEAEAVYARWLHDSDPVPTRIVLATYAANMVLTGDPVWTMLVGGSGAGKTERIMPLASMPSVVMASTITGEAALLSASPKRERAANATGGLLRMIGDHGLIVVKDFTSVISMSRDRRSEVIAALREVFDGRWDRHYGTDGGQVLTWQGHCGFLAGCTTAIDSAHSVLDAMGTRFLFVRLPDGDGEQMGRSALAHAGNEKQMRAELAEVTAGLLGNLGDPHELHDGVRTWLLPLALMASRGRSPILRDSRGEIELVLDAEAPTRIIKQLGQLWRACGMLGLDESDSWAVVRRAGLDSIPKLRRAVIECLAAAGTWQATTEVAKTVQHPPRTTRRALEDLAAHGLVVRLDTPAGGTIRYDWALSAQARNWWNAINPQNPQNRQNRL